MRQTRIFLLVVLTALAAHAAPLFDKPLHLTRSIEEPLTGKSVVVDEYFFGSRVVTARGDRTVIADYDRREITEIDRAAATYSITRFEDLAAARGPRRAQLSAAPPLRARSDRRGGRNVEVFTADDRAAGMHAEIAVHRSIELTGDAFDVVVGAAYPSSGGAGADLARGAARIPRVSTASIGAAAASDRYALPVEQIFRWEAAGETITSNNRVTRVGSETAPPELVSIPAGARRVAAHQLESKRLADEIDGKH